MAESKNAIPAPAKGNWNEQKSKLKAKFSTLTDKDLHYEENEKEEMLRKIQLKLGVTKEEINKVITTH